MHALAGGVESLCHHCRLRHPAADHTDVGSGAEHVPVNIKLRPWVPMLVLIAWAAASLTRASLSCNKAAARLRVTRAAPEGRSTLMVAESLTGLVWHTPPCVNTNCAA